MAESYDIPVWETRFRQIADNVWAYVQAGGSWMRSNAGLVVGDDYAVLIDSLATVGLTRGLLEEVRKVTDKPVRYIINTHHHGDHVWGNQVLSQAHIICHRLGREELLRNAVPDPALLGMMFADLDFKGIAATPPHITFESQLSLHCGSREVRAIYLGPGHSVSDVIVYLPREGVVFGGDLLFLYSTPLGTCGSFEGWIKAMDIMGRLDAATYVPGHGPVCSRDGVEESRRYLVLVRDEARKRFDRGMNADEAARDIDLGRFRKWAAWERILFNLERLAREFAGEPPDSHVDEASIMMRAMVLAAERKQ
jgi:cyclase